MSHLVIPQGLERLKLLLPEGEALVGELLP